MTVLGLSQRVSRSSLTAFYMNQSSRQRSPEQIAREFDVLKEIEKNEAEKRKVEAGKNHGRGQISE